MCVQYHGGYHEYHGGISEYCGDTHHHGGYHDAHGIIMSTVGVFRTVGDIIFCNLSTVRGYHHICGGTS